jgi:hypothetical protein
MARRHRESDTALHFLTEHKGEQYITAAHALQFGKGEKRRRQRRGRMDRGRNMRVAKVENVSAGGVEECRAQRIDALAPADQRRLAAAGKLSELFQCRFDRCVAAAG